MADSRAAPTTDRLRHDIDRGRMADKVDFPDPAAAPLGTDSEAAGTPAGPAARWAAQADLADDGRRGETFPLAFLLMMIAVIVAVAIAAYWALALR